MLHRVEIDIDGVIGAVGLKSLKAADSVRLSVVEGISL